MKMLFTLALSITAISAMAQVAVHGYVRKDGTYVAPHVRSSPDNTNLNNYGTQGNVNPYTGQAGTIQPVYTPAPTYQVQPTQKTCKDYNGAIICY